MKKVIDPKKYRLAAIIILGLMAIATVILVSLVLIAEEAMKNQMPDLLRIRFAGCLLPVSIGLLAFVGLNYLGSRNPFIEGMFDFPYFRSEKRKVIDAYLVLSLLVTFLLVILGIMFMVNAFPDPDGTISWALFFASWAFPHTYTVVLTIADAILAKDKKRLIQQSILIGVFGIAAPLVGIIGFLGYSTPIYQIAFAFVPLYYLLSLSLATGKEGDISLDSED